MLIKEGAVIPGKCIYPFFLGMSSDDVINIIGCDYSVEKRPETDVFLLENAMFFFNKKKKLYQIGVTYGFESKYEDKIGIGDTMIQVKKEYGEYGEEYDANPDGNDGMILEYFTIDDIDKDTLRRYRQVFKVANDGHVWNELDDKAFLEKLGGYRKERREGKEGLTLAGLLMFGDGLAIRNEFSNIFMDYRDESAVTSEIRWNDRVTYDGTWENNLYNFFSKVTPKITADLPKPFKLEGNMRIDDTPLHKAVREAFVNLIIHSDYLMDAGTLKIIKRADGFEFTNPGILKLPIEDIYQGGNSKPRNPHMQTMLRMVGFGDNAGSGFPTILSVWKENGWIEPELKEDTRLNQVTLTFKMILKKNGLINAGKQKQANENKRIKASE